MKPKTNATEVVLKHLKNKRSINQLQCLDLTGSWRLSGIIHTLRGKGYAIESKDVKVKTRYGIPTTVTKYLYKGVAK